MLMLLFEALIILSLQSECKRLDTHWCLLDRILDFTMCSETQIRSTFIFISSVMFQQVHYTDSIIHLSSCHYTLNSVSLIRYFIMHGLYGDML